MMGRVKENSSSPHPGFLSIFSRQSFWTRQKSNGISEKNVLSLVFEEKLSLSVFFFKKYIFSVIMISPCCFGITLKKGVKFIALFELSIYIVTAVGTIVLLASTKNYSIKPKSSRNVNPDSTTSKPNQFSSTPIPFIPGKEINGLVTEAEDRSSEETVMIFLLLLLIGEIVLSWILYRGASKEKFRHLHAWWWIKLIMMVFFLLFDMIDVFSGENRKLEFVVCAQVLYQGYVLWLVRALMDEIRGIGPPRFTQLTPPKVATNSIEEV